MNTLMTIVQILAYNDIPRAIVFGLAAGLINENVYQSDGISSSFAWWLGAVALICCVVAVFSLLHYFLGNDHKILAIISLVVGIIIANQSFGIIKTVTDYEAYYDAEVARIQKGQISFMSNSVLCTQCRGRKKCTICKGNKIALYGNIYLKCKACDGSGECELCHGTGRKYY